MNEFHARAQDVVNAIVQSPQWGPYSNGINFWTEDIVSKDNAPFDPANPIPRDTAFMSTFGSDPGSRLIVSRSMPPATLAAVTDAVHFTKVHIILVIVNTDRDAGSASIYSGIRYVQLTTNDETHQVVIHELGHALLQLLDEYSYNPPACDPSAVDSPNTTSNPNVLPAAWQQLAQQGAVPKPLEGAAYCKTGAWRPVDEDCLMQVLSRPFCPVCTARLKEVFGHVVTGKTQMGPPSTPPTGASLVNPDGTPLVCQGGFKF